MSAKSKRRAAMKRKGCTDKVRYSNLMQAMNAGVRTGLNWYRCHWCKGYHLTSRDVPRTASKNRQSFSNAKHPRPSRYSDKEYGCYETKLGLVPEQVEALMEESEYAYEDFELSDAARCDIKAFCESFNEKYAETVYFPNWSVGVVKD